MRLRRLRSGAWSLVRLRWWRPWWPAMEVWIRRDVGGHAPGCRMRPTVPVNAAPDCDCLHCDCYASTWRRPAGWRP